MTFACPQAGICHLFVELGGQGMLAGVLIRYFGNKKNRIHLRSQHLNASILQRATPLYIKKTKENNCFPKRILAKDGMLYHIETYCIIILI